MKDNLDQSKNIVDAVAPNERNPIAESVIHDRIERLLEWLRAHDYNYASINSIPDHAIIRFFQRRIPRGGVMVRQLFRLSPWDLRSWFGGRRQSMPFNPKASILLAAALFMGSEDQENTEASDLQMLLDRVCELRSAHCRNFAVRQNKTLYMLNYLADQDEVAPLLTAMAGLLFLERWERLGSDKDLELARSTVRYFLEEHPVDQYPEGIYFRYDPKYTFITYNASAFISGFLVAAGQKLQMPEAVELGQHGMDFIMAAQEPNRSWFYGRKGKYIDNFHTFIMIWALQLAADAGYAPAQNGLKPALDFWMQNFGERRHFRHFTGKHLPLNSSLLQKVDLRDLTIPAVFLLKYSDRYPEYRKIADRLMAKLVYSMGNGRNFYSEKTWLWSNRIPYIEFQAWALLALMMYKRCDQAGVRQKP